MIIYLVEWIVEQYGPFPGSGLFQYSTFRAGVAIILSLIISLLLGGRIIRFLRRQQIGETVRDLGLEGQQQKQGTPTMGGVIIILGILVPCLLMARLDNVYIVIMIVATSWMGLIGFADDYIKVFRKKKDGLAGKFKIVGQVGFGLFISLMMLFSDQVVVRMDVADGEAAGLTVGDMVGEPIIIEREGQPPLYRADYKTTLTNVPFRKGNNLDYAQLLPLERNKALKYGWVIFVPLIIFIVTAVSNSANLTDGLDGLATGVSSVIGTVLAIFAYVSGNILTANYLDIHYLPGTSELFIYAACLLGSCLGFLWYNSFPAQVFMGDTGSLTLGGVIAALAILLRKELLLPLLCGIFLAESLSVILQVSYFKYTKRRFGEGRRIFRMSPLHHHFQKLGMPETKIVARFWIVGIILAVATILTLKIR